MTMKQEANNARAGVRLRVAERMQTELKVQCVDDLLPAKHQARTIWSVVCELDLSAFYQSIQVRDADAGGRDSTDPRILVSLWLYASVRGVASARELDRLCKESRPYQWLCGGVTVNHHLLSDFRVEHADALDALFSQVIATLVKKGLVKVRRISQDGLRLRASAGASSFRRSSTLKKLHAQAVERMRQLRALMDDPEKSAGLSARRKAARLRAARQRQQRIEAALELIPKLQQRQQRAAKRLSKKQKTEQQSEVRASTTDAQASRMKMGDGGFRPAVNVQLAVDTQSRAIVGVEVSDQGTDYQQSEPMRKQVEQRAGQKVQEHLYDGGFVTTEMIERATEQGVTVYAPVKPPRNRDKQPGDQYVPRPNDSAAIADWRVRMGGESGRTIYRQRASTVETINAQMRRSGLSQLTVRGLLKARSVALWAALAWNLTQFAGAWTG